MQGVTCDGPGVPEIGGSGDGLQDWQRATNDFWAVLITFHTAFLFSIVVPAYQTPRQ